MAALAVGFAGPSSAAVPPRGTVVTPAAAGQVEPAVSRDDTGTGRGAPVRLRIPAIGVTSSLVRLGLR
ncbi:MAG: class F sortase, partial [Candidatus Nanopelagicales bacterium]